MPASPLPAELTTGQTIQIPITFAPSSAGPIGAMLTATTSSRKKATFGLSGVGQTLSAKLNLEVSGQLGINQLTLSLGGLPAGDYRLDATPISASGKPAATRYLHVTTTA